MSKTVLKPIKTRPLAHTKENLRGLWSQVITNVDLLHTARVKYNVISINNTGFISNHSHTKSKYIVKIIQTKYPK